MDPNKVKTAVWLGAIGGVATIVGSHSRGSSITAHRSQGSRSTA